MGFLYNTAMKNVTGIPRLPLLLVHLLLFIADADVLLRDIIKGRGTKWLRLIN